MSSLLKTEGLTHVYGAGTPFETVAIENIDIEIEKGELLGVIGHTGSGKSTFIQHLNGLLKPTSGRVLLGGEDINVSKERSRDARFRVGLVFQYPEYQLFEETVRRDIAFGPGNMGLSEAEIDRRVREAAGFVGLSGELFEVSPLELSGGQKRRVAIAGVIAMEPEVLVLDEPTAGLDPEGRENLLKNIRDYRDATGAAVLLVSHSMDDVARCADRLAVFSGSRIAMLGTPAEVFSRDAELEEIGLTVPQATKIARALRNRGVPLPAGIFTLEQLERALLDMKGAGVC
ncbi:MAG: energy-coupling factor transporter ATPase [Candidatus Heteroscillospira sp.]|jgi:energy-coupling factor transport system ATP-binding protein